VYVRVAIVNLIEQNYLQPPIFTLLNIFSMNEQLIKESVSIKFLEVIANYNGYSTDWPGKDFGRDLTINEIGYRTEANGDKRQTETGRCLKIQAKATTDNSIKHETDFFKFDLESSTYNDLIRRNNQSNFPLILFVFILPPDKNEWIEIYSDSLIIKKAGFWFVPDVNAVETTNSSSIRIEVKKENIFTKDSLKNLMDKFN
jgi:hypothetical protein